MGGLCVVCRKPANVSCELCGLQWYCSFKCKCADKESHENLCCRLSFLMNMDDKKINNGLKMWYDCYKNYDNIINIYQLCNIALCTLERNGMLRKALDQIDSHGRLIDYHNILKIAVNGEIVENVQCLLNCKQFKAAAGPNVCWFIESNNKEIARMLKEYTEDPKQIIYSSQELVFKSSKLNKLNNVFFVFE